MAFIAVIVSLVKTQFERLRYIREHYQVVLKNLFVESYDNYEKINIGFILLSPLEIKGWYSCYYIHLNNSKHKLKKNECEHRKQNNHIKFKITPSFNIKKYIYIYLQGLSSPNFLVVKITIQLVITRTHNSENNTENKSD